jgi:hypothetical protein
MPSMPAMPAMLAASEWETRWTNEGRPYFYNRTTQSSVWDIPPEVMLAIIQCIHTHVYTYTYIYIYMFLHVYMCC